jgi:methylmalonyl-CoA epimerase
MVKKIDHIGFAVKSIAAARVFYENLGLVCEKIEYVESQKVKTAFFKIGEIHIELLEPTADDSAVAKFLSKNGEGFHHIAYKSEDIQAELGNMRESGCKLIHQTPITGAGGKQVAFLHPHSTFGVLTEFCME